MRRYIVPVVRLFPIWRYGEHYDRASTSAVMVMGWFPDRFEDRRFASETEAHNFIRSF